MATTEPVTTLRRRKIAGPYVYIPWSTLMRRALDQRGGGWDRVPERLRNLAPSVVVVQRGGMPRTNPAAATVAAARASRRFDRLCAAHDRRVAKQERKAARRGVAA